MPKGFDVFFGHYAEAFSREIFERPHSRGAQSRMRLDGLTAGGFEGA